jgi:hypothetical protein
MASYYPGVEHGLKKNHRKFPGIKGKRPDHKAARVAVAKENAQAYANLSLEEKKLRNPNKYADKTTV